MSKGDSEKSVTTTAIDFGILKLLGRLTNNTGLMFERHGTKISWSDKTLVSPTTDLLGAVYQMSKSPSF